MLMFILGPQQSIASWLSWKMVVGNLTSIDHKDYVLEGLSIHQLITLMSREMDITNEKNMLYNGLLLWEESLTHY